MPTKDGKHAYSEEERAEIIAHVLVNVACGRFVSRILREDDMTENGIPLPNQSCFWKWVLTDETGEIEGKLASARAKGIEALLDELPDIADDGTNDWIERKRDDGSTYEALNGEHIQRSKLRIETRIKLAQMMKPKTYGPKLDLTSGNEKIGFAQAVEEGRKRVLEAQKKLTRGDDE